MSDRYRIPAGRFREEEIKRSRFITTLAYTPSLELARGFIGEMKEEFSDASHNCWAYLVGPPAGTSKMGYSDDGEPHGTAGRPMFTVLQHSDVGDIAAVVTRYFGGTKLGKGGLVKAYSGGVQYGLEGLPLAEHVTRAYLEIVIDYTSVTAVQRMLPQYEVEAVAEDYGVDVTYKLRLPEEQYEPFVKALMGLTNGQVLFEQSAEND